jgi:hypothetical protein
MGIVESMKSDCVKFITVHFPFSWRTSGSNQLNAKANLIGNLAVCRLMSHFFTRGKGDSSWTELLIEYLGDLFKGEVALVRDHSQGLDSALLVLKRILRVSSGDVQSRLLKDFTELYNKSHPLSAQKRLCVNYISQFLSVSSFPPPFTGRFPSISIFSSSFVLPLRNQRQQVLMMVNL